MDRYNQIAAFNRYYSVSRETLKCLEKYEKILIDYNKKMNLIGKSTVLNIWDRHILDSYQVIDFIDKNDKILVDMGSGAGFPGLILSIATKDKKMPLKVILIEKSSKKADFLKKTIIKLKLNAEVICKNILDKQEIIPGEFFIARAFKPLPVILKLMHTQVNNFKKIIIFLGKTGKEDLLQASKTWDIQYKERISLTSSDSTIIEITKLKKK